LLSESLKSTWKTNTEKTEQVKNICHYRQGERSTQEAGNRRGYETFVVPDDIGGRFSVLTAVGLLPIAVAGIDIDSMMKGAADARELYSNPNLMENDCYKYAAVRNALYRKNKTIEIMVNYEPSLHYFTEWWKQLYGESEGKDQKGIFRPELTSLRTFIPWDSIYRMDSGTYLKR